MFRDRKKRHRDNEDDYGQRPIKQERPDDYGRRPIKSEPDDGQRREQQHERQQNDQRRRNRRQERGGNPFQNNEETMEYGVPNQGGETEAAVDKAEPNFELSGKLAEDTNTYRGIVIKYNEPVEARKPRTRWRMYGFKGDEALPMLPIHRQSAYLLGRERRVADIPVDHPSCSKQHAVLQYRLVEYQRDDGRVGRRVRPYIIDLGSTNGTYVNNNRIEAQRYVELMEKDVVKFGFSSREYVILHEKSKDDEEEEDTGVEEDSNPPPAAKS